MASLLTGAPPEVHGLRSDRFHVPRRRGLVHPLPKVLAEAGLPSSAFMCQVPFLMRGLAGRIACHLGLTGASLSGRVTAGALETPAHLLDVPPTILDALGVPVPTTYPGRPLIEAFAPAAIAV